MAEFHHRSPVEEAAHRRGNVLAIAVVALALITLAFAITILVLLTNHLMPGGDCLFTTASQSVNVCHYGLATCILSFLFSIINVFALCRPPLAIGAVSGVGTIWWLGYAITVSVYGHSASNAGMPAQHYRASVIGLSWACFACELLIFGLSSHLYHVKWEPEEIGRGTMDEFDSYVQFKARQEAESRGRGPTITPV